MSESHVPPTKQAAAQQTQPQMPEGQQLTNSFAPPAFSLNASPVQRQADPNVAQLMPGDLKKQMDRLLTQCPVVNEAYLNTIHNATTAERQAILNDATLMAAIRNSIGGDQATVVVSALMEGSQQWRNPTANEFYTFFCVNNGNGPLPNTATMNCWESIMYAAFLAGQTTAAFIRDFYNRAFAGGDANANVWAQLGFSTSLNTYPTTTPRAGQWIFYLPAGDVVPSHIALSQGGDLATSLWSEPNNIDSVQRIRVNDLATSGGSIYIGNPILR